MSQLDGFMHRSYGSMEAPKPLSVVLQGSLYVAQPERFLSRGTKHEVLSKATGRWWTRGNSQNVAQVIWRKQVILTAVHPTPAFRHGWPGHPLHAPDQRLERGAGPGGVRLLCALAKAESGWFSRCVALASLV